MATIPIEELPVRIGLADAVQTACRREVGEIVDAVCAGQSVLVECDKLLAPHLVRAVRTVLRTTPGAPRMRMVDHRRESARGAVAATTQSLREAVDSLAEAVREEDAGSVIVVVPNFDVMVSSDLGGTHLDMTAREVMAIAYENPELRLLAFEDPNLTVPRVLRELFSRRVTAAGIHRADLAHLVTRDEARRMSTRGFEPYRLHKYVSGMNVVKLRTVLQGLCSPRFTDDAPGLVIPLLRQATLASAEVELPHVPMDSIGGYEAVKALLRENVIDVLRTIEERSAGLGEAELMALERLVPRNVLLIGPPGTGKTLLAKAMATALSATVMVVSGPELKSRWVGESEERIRKLFARARRCAPSLIVFDEIDSFAGRRQSGQAPGEAHGRTHDHSMLNQLLTEMDGFRSQETVFVVATTNFASSLDDALRSRFRYEIELPYPGRSDRRAILEVYDRQYGLRLGEDAVEAILDETEAWVDQSTWTRFSGRDLEGLAAALGRRRLLATGTTGRAAPEITAAMARQAARERIRTRRLPLTFDDIGGYEDMKARLRSDLVDLLLLARHTGDDELRRRIERVVPKGVIFEGPPGTGKTLFARALAGALGATVTVVNGPELKSMWHGDTERRIRELFFEARRNAPSVVVLDEIDSIAGDRAGVPSGVDRSMVNQLLTEMDGMAAREQVFVIATTNFAESLDRALRRPGRFEHVLHIGYPDAQARRAILSLYDERYELSLGEKALDYLVSRTAGFVDAAAGVRFSGDHLEAICRAAARCRLRDPAFEPTRPALDALVSQRSRLPSGPSPEGSGGEAS